MRIFFMKTNEVSKDSMSKKQILRCYCWTLNKVTTGYLVFSCSSLINRENKFVLKCNVWMYGISKMQYDFTYGELNIISCQVLILIQSSNCCFIEWERQLGKIVVFAVHTLGRVQKKIDTSHFVIRLNWINYSRFQQFKNPLMVIM